MESDLKMKTSRSSSRLAIVSVLATLALSGCGGFNGADEAQFDASYSHPISVQQDVPTLNVAATGALSQDDRRAISAFAAAYKERGHGPLSVATPSGSANTTIAMNTLVDVRELLGQSGIPASRVTYTPYRASSAAERAPIILSYTRYAATATPCGDWTDDLAYMPDNTSPANFGCATQNNLAAMVADPADLVMPRTMTASDAQRRGTVFEKYRKGEITATTRDQHDSAALSEVAK
jgi:pilus assembly protein CpaD